MEKGFARVSKVSLSLAKGAILEKMSFLKNGTYVYMYNELFTLHFLHYRPRSRYFKHSFQDSIAMQEFVVCLLMLASRAHACASQHSRAENATAEERGLRMGLARSDVRLPNHATSSMEEKGMSNAMAAWLRELRNYVSTTLAT